MRKPWCAVSAGDKLYVLVYSQYLMWFDKIDVPEMFTAHVESVEKSDHRLNKDQLISCECVRDDTGDKFKIYINGYFPSMRSVEIDGCYYEMNTSSSFLASYKTHDSDDKCRVVAFDKDLYDACVTSLRNKARTQAKKKISVIKEQLKIIDKTLRVK